MCGQRGWASPIASRKRGLSDVLRVTVAGRGRRPGRSGDTAGDQHPTEEKERLPASTERRGPDPLP